MSRKTCETRMPVVPTPMNLPIFISRRTRFRDDYWRTVPKYIEKSKGLYSKRCYEERHAETRDERNLKHLLGLNPLLAKPCTALQTLKASRNLDDTKSWQLSPNIYDTTKEPFANKRGYFGSYWRKLDSVKLTNERFKDEKLRLWDLPTTADRLNGPGNKHKGVFPSNARQRRATTRCMINDLSGIYRSPTEPSPTDYSSPLHELSRKISPVITVPRPNPHLFLRHTSVPDKCLPLIRRHTSFEPAVGRYETRFPKLCDCGSKILTPGLHLIVDREKRYKFRRLPYRKIVTRRRCSPDWAHVAGRGFRRLFRTPTGKPIISSKSVVEKAKEKSKSKSPDKTFKYVNLYSDSKYLTMINTPRKEPISVRVNGMPKVPPKIRFNCMYKHVTRRQLRNNKKIAFSSGVSRSPELEIRPVPLTIWQLNKLKESLPPERQLRDYPTMTKSLTEITSRLYNMPPTHMRPAHEQPLRKRLFKFKPLPEPKVLVPENQLRPKGPEPLSFYNKPINPRNFFKGRIKKSVSFKSETAES